MGRFHDGAASIALRTGIPVVPLALIGTSEMKKGHIAAIIGDPIEVEKGKPTPEAIKALNDRIKAAIQTMIDDYNKGAYEGIDGY